MKRLLIFGMMTAIVSLAILSCKDDFNEEDFLNLQAKKKLEQDSIIRARDFALVDETSKAAVEEFIAAVNEAGDLLSVTLMVRENGVPVPGVSVSLTTGTANAVSSGRAKAVQTAATDASGNVVFENVVIGSGTISFSKTGYISATATVDFGQPAQPQEIQTTINGTTIKKYIPPVKRFEEAVVPLFSATAGTGSTATITGRVIIENDVTNTTPEVPAGVVIRANLAGLFAGNNAFITGYTLADNSSLGVATVGANGVYTMTVPASAAGLTIPLIIPNIEGNSRMAVNGYDNGTGTAVALPSPEYRDVPSSWGPQAPVGFGTLIPAVAGARLVFPTAPAVGSGLSFDYTPVGKPIGIGNIVSVQTAAINGNFYRINSRGNYSNGAAPTVGITGGGGAGATARANMQTYVSSLTVTNGGSGYDGMIRINLVRERGVLGDFVEGFIEIPATTTNSLPATIDLTAFAADAGFSAGNKNLMNGADLTGLKITVTEGADGGDGTGGQVTGVFETEVAFVEILTSGDGYSSAPTFTFTGGGLTDGSSDHANVEVVNFPRNWTITPNNTNTSDYGVMPTFSVTYPPSPLGTITAEPNVDVFSPSGSLEQNATSLATRLTISSGDIVKRHPGTVLVTNTQSGSAPTIIVTPILPVNATRTMDAFNISATDGSITTFPFFGNDGDGYNAPVTVTVLPTIPGAPGSGAVISLTNTFDVNTLEYTWTGGATIQNPGSGYLLNLNRKGQQNASLPTSVSNVQPGKTYTVDINYGTGNRRAQVN